jgi:hypothetical protein
MIGSDPEYFIVQENKIIPAVQVLNEPIIHNRGFITIDGVVAEMNPMPGSPETVASNISYLKDLFLDYLRRDYPDVELRFVSSMEVPLDVIKEAGTYDESALEFGCSPDLQAYEGEETSYRGDASQIPYRFAGGHIHLDCPPDPKVIKMVDSIVGLVVNDVNAVSYTTNQEEHSSREKLRREYYGRAGVHRQKHYGLEWRVPSAAIFDNTKMLVKYLTFAEKIAINYKKIDKLPIDDFQEVKRIINNGEVYKDAWNWA